MSEIRLEMNVSHNLAKTAEEMRALKDRLERAVTKSGRTGTGILAAAAREAIPEGHEEGRLPDHIHTRDTLVTKIREGSGHFEATVGSTSKIAGYLEYGTRPHVIEPTSVDGVLAFRIGGRLIFAKRVFHPGTRPIHWIEKAITETQGPFFEEFRRNVKRAMEGGEI